MTAKAATGGGVIDIEEIKRPRRLAPTSLVDYALSRGYCSVTDLVSPVWCEYAFQYNLLGMSHLPLSQRPEQIATPQGNVIKPNIEIAQEREKVLKSGREVHKRLEKEVHPVRIRVETTTKEDTWGLRLLQLITGLKVLMEDGCCRELPVFGFIEGTLVFGVIDELRVHYDKVDAGTPQKLYSSQEEWKKKSSQPKKAKIDTGQRSLAAFIPGVKVTKKEEEESKGERTFGFVLEDAKTRLSMSMPEEKDQIQSKLQCMLYKRILEGIIAGFSNNTAGAHIDFNATPVTPEGILNYLGLDDDVPLSSAFMRDAEVLCQSFQFSLKVNQDDQGKWSCNLKHLFALLTSVLDDLIRMAQRGAKIKETFSIIQDELRLTYRRRDGKWQKKKAIVRPRRSVKDSSMDLRKLLQGGVRVEDLDEEAQVEFALQVSLGDTQKEEEEERLADHTIAMPPSPRKAKTKDVIIGTAKFNYDSQLLQQHIVDIMAMWRGERALRGVTVEQTWRCNHCEYQTDCEWRALKADESLQKSKEKKQAEEEQAMWDQLDDLPDGMEW